MVLLAEERIDTASLTLILDIHFYLSVFSLKSLANTILPEAIPAIHQWLKNQNETGILNFARIS